jgi:Na+-driven multidrug efflux pump
MAVAFVIVYYIIGIPLSYCLTYPANLQMPGTWLASAINAIIIDICFFIILKVTDINLELN